MKMQGVLISALVFALITAIFAVFNVESVPVDYIFGTANIPLILVILGSTLLGGLIVGLFGIIRQIKLLRQIRTLEQLLGKREGGDAPEDAGNAAPSPAASDERPDSASADTADASAHR